MTYSADMNRINGPRRKTRWVRTPAPGTADLRPVIGQPDKFKHKTGRIYRLTAGRWYRLEDKS